MKKVAIIVQRYGAEVNGGAEYHAMILAEQLITRYDIEVLSTCAKDYHSWANEYAEGTTEINGVKVRRFKVDHPRNKSKVHLLLKKLNKRTLLQQALRHLGILNHFERLLSLKDNFKQIGDKWSKQQGPYAPGLITYLQENEHNYDALIFFTYLYYPTFFGLRIAPHKSILIPTAHDEPAIHLPVFRDFFNLPKAILYNTISEQKLVQSLFNNERIYSDVVGIGISSSDKDINIDPALVLNSDAAYFIYIGRIDPGKGSDLMLSHFIKYKSETPTKVKLVLIGKASMEIPKHEDIVYLGFVNEDLKLAMLSTAKALIMPSEHESLSLVTLESLVYGVPVIVNGASEVLVNHVVQSKAGKVFTDYNSFRAALNFFLSNDVILQTIPDRAKSYVATNYSWKIVLEKINRAIDYVSH
ncbi:MAG: glycosyltransferase family 1 protein [Flavobacterium sp.]|nr:MAG: glycosyltransferase family 1 protein [Flavobacterium sp.]